MIRLYITKLTDTNKQTNGYQRGGVGLRDMGEVGEKGKKKNKVKIKKNELKKTQLYKKGVPDKNQRFVDMSQEPHFLINDVWSFFSPLEIKWYSTKNALQIIKIKITRTFILLQLLLLPPDVASWSTEQPV